MDIFKLKRPIQAFEAQQRLGKALGTEFNAKLKFQANEALALTFQGGIFMPGQFYEQEISRSAGTALGSNDLQNFWALSGGAKLDF